MRKWTDCGSNYLLVSLALERKQSMFAENKKHRYGNGERFVFHIGAVILCYVFRYVCLLGAPSILVADLLVKSPTKSPFFFCIKWPKYAVWLSCYYGFEIFIATELQSSFLWLETENWWFEIGDLIGDIPQKIGN